MDDVCRRGDIARYQAKGEDNIEVLRLGCNWPRISTLGDDNVVESSLPTFLSMSSPR